MARYVILFVSFFALLHAEIIETNRMEEMLPYIDENTWILFDIDDTLLESELQAGRTKWFYNEFQKLLSEGFDKKTVIRQIDEEFLKIVDLCPIRTPEKEIPFLLHQIKQSGSAVMALTARGPNLCHATLKQLDRLGIDLSSHAPKTLLPEPCNAAHYEKGILFAIDQRKGPALRIFLERSDQRPGKIVFIDDQKRHLTEVEKELSDLGISFIGFHYTKTLERPFDAEQSEIEHQTLLNNVQTLDWND